MENYLFYAGCSNAEQIQQCRYSLLRLLQTYNLRPPSTLQVVVQTRKAAAFELFQPFFQSFRIDADEQPEQNLADWVEAMAERHPGNLLFLPANSIFTQSPDVLFHHIGNGKLVLSKNDEAYAVTPVPTLAGFSSMGVEPRGQSVVRPTLSSLYSNAGTGQNNGKQAPPNSQFCDEAILVYKPFRQLNKALNHFFKENEEESVPNLVKKAHRLHLETLIDGKAAFDLLPFWQKWMRRLTGQRLKLQNYSTKLSP